MSKPNRYKYGVEVCGCLVMSVQSFVGWRSQLCRMSPSNCLGCDPPSELSLNSLTCISTCFLLHPFTLKVGPLGVGSGEKSSVRWRPKRALIESGGAKVMSSSLALG